MPVTSNCKMLIPYYKNESISEANHGQLVSLLTETCISISHVMLERTMLRVDARFLRKIT